MLQVNSFMSYITSFDFIKVEVLQSYGIINLNKHSVNN